MHLWCGYLNACHSEAPQLIYPMSTDCQRKSNYASMMRRADGMAQPQPEPPVGPLFSAVPELQFGGESEKIKMAFLLHQFNLDKRAWRASRGAVAGAHTALPRSISPRRSGIIEIHLIIGPRLAAGMRNWTPSPFFLICWVRRPLGRAVEISIWSCLDHRYSRRSSIQFSFRYDVVMTAS